jgi:ligand-binding sensor domain-containing protein
MKNIFISIFFTFYTYSQICAQYEFTTFGESEGLPNKNCRGIAIDSSGTLWAGTQEGVAKWDGSEFVHVPINDGVTTPFVKTIQVAPDGNIWVGYLTIADELGLSVIDPDGNLILHVDSVLSGQSGTRVNDIEFGPDGLVYVAHTDGVSTFDGQEWQLETASTTNFAAAPIWDIEFAKDGSVWMATIFGLAHKKLDGTWEHFYSLSTDLIYDDVRTLEFGPDDRLWIGTSRGLSIYDGQGFENYWVTEGLPDEFIRDIAFDETGLAWLATDDGFSIFNGEEFQNFKTYVHPTINDKIENVIIDPTVGTWLTTREGMVKVETAVSALHHPVEIASESIKVFPLPAQNYVQVQWEAEKMGEVQRIQLVSDNGSLVRQFEIEPGQDEIRLDLQGLISGEYWLRFETGSGTLIKMLCKI